MMTAELRDPISDGVEGQGERISRLGAMFLGLAAFVCYACLFGAAFYSWTMTVSGFIGTKLLPDNSIIGNWVTPRLVGVIIEASILAYYVALPYFSVRGKLVQWSATLLYAILFLITFIFSLFAITHTSQGENLVAERGAQLQQVNDVIGRTDRSITSTYSGFVSGLDQNATRACAGFDESGIRKCGSIAKGYSARSNDFREKFGAQLSGAGSVVAIGGRDFASDLAVTEANYRALEGRMVAFNAFGQESGISTQFAKDAVQAARQQLDSVSRKTSTTNLDAKGLVTERVFSGLWGAVKFQAEPVFYLAIMIAALPLVISLLCSALLKIIADSNSKAIQIKRVAEQLEQEAEATKKYAGVVELLRRLRDGARWQRRSANVETAVDRSVSDVS
jgi:hypothetical protein